MSIMDFFERIKKENRLGQWGLIAFLIGAVIVIALVLSVLDCHAVSVRFTWEAPTTNTDGSPLTDLGGYNLCYGTESDVYSTCINVGDVTSYLWDLGAVENTTLFFNVNAFDLSGNSSDYDGEVAIPFGPLRPNPPTNLQGVMAQ
jgi:hypothetical protein